MQGNGRNLFVPVTRPWRQFLAVAVIILVLMFFVKLLETDFNVIALIGMLFTKELASFWMSFGAAVSASIVAAIVYGSIENRGYKKRLETIRNIASPALLEDVMDTLDHYNGRYCEDYRVEIKLHEHAHRMPFLLCRITYEYKKYRGQEPFVFRIVRIRNETDQEAAGRTPTSLTNNYLQHELFYVLNEIDLIKYENTASLDTFYRIFNLQIDGQTAALMPVDNNPLHCIAEPTAAESGRRLYHLKYSIEFPFERESVLYPSIELPTNGFLCSFDFSEVKNEILVWSQAFFSSKVDPTASIEHEDGFVNYNYRGWLLPKSSVVFTWWRRNE